MASCNHFCCVTFVSKKACCCLRYDVRNIKVLLNNCVGKFEYKRLDYFWHVDQYSISSPESLGLGLGLVSSNTICSPWNLYRSLFSFPFPPYTQTIVCMLCSQEQLTAGQYQFTQYQQLYHRISHLSGTFQRNSLVATQVAYGYDFRHPFGYMSRMQSREQEV